MGKDIWKGCESFKPGGKEASALGYDYFLFACFLILRGCGLNFAVLGTS